MLENRPQREGWEETEPSHDQGGCHEESGEHWLVGRYSAICHLPPDLTGKKTGKCKRGNRQSEASYHHGTSRREVVEKGVRIQACETLPVVGKARRIGLEDLRETMSSCVCDQPRAPRFCRDGQGCEGQYGERTRERRTVKRRL